MFIRLPRHSFVCLLLISLSLLSTSNLFAQAGQAEITGEIKDRTGALVPQAKVIATEVRTNQVFTSVSGEEGAYTLTNLRPGLYTLAVEAASFKRYVREGIQ